MHLSRGPEALGFSVRGVMWSRGLRGCPSSRLWRVALCSWVLVWVSSPPLRSLLRPLLPKFLCPLVPLAHRCICIGSKGHTYRMRRCASALRPWVLGTSVLSASVSSPRACARGCSLVLTCRGECYSSRCLLALAVALWCVRSRVFTLGRTRVAWFRVGFGAVSRAVFRAWVSRHGIGDSG